MARGPRLKVYRLPIGFHDAYVAAPTQKAAIEAWGSDTDVFTLGQAEIVADPALTEAPLASPGTVVKRLRGTAAEQIAALGKEETPARPERKAKDEPEAKRKARPKPPPKPKPRPSRTALDDAERELADAEARHDSERKAIAEREAALARERKALERKQDRERERLEARRDKAEAAFDQAMRRWRQS